MSALRHGAALEGNTDPADEGRKMTGAQTSSIFDGSLAELGEMFRGAETLAAIRTLPEQNQVIAPRGPVALTTSRLPADSNPADWTKTLTLVERAAATIKAYERRFLQLEKQSKALADRALEDQQRLHAHVHALEERLKQTEERVVAAEAASRDAEYHEWETEMRAKRAEQRATEAETRSRQAEAYLRRVHELLSGMS